MGVDCTVYLVFGVLVPIGDAKIRKLSELVDEDGHHINLGGGVKFTKIDENDDNSVGVIYLKKRRFHAWRTTEAPKKVGLELSVEQIDALNATLEGMGIKETPSWIFIASVG